MSGIGLEIVNWCLVLGKFISRDFFHFYLLELVCLVGECGSLCGFWVFKLLTIGPSRLVAVMAIRITDDQLR
jgi:hypothetical protein